jgi:hypothetical protein
MSQKIGIKFNTYFKKSILYLQYTLNLHTCRVSYVCSTYMCRRPQTPFAVDVQRSDHYRYVQLYNYLQVYNLYKRLFIYLKPGFVTK